MAACERLRSTPVPFAYTLLLRRTACLFCVILPLRLRRRQGHATPLPAGFFGLDTLSEELEEPFGTSPNDLPMEALAKGIAITLRRALDDPDLPEMPRPVDHVLLQAGTGGHHARPDKTLKHIRFVPILRARIHPFVSLDRRAEGAEFWYTECSFYPSS